MDHTFIEDNNIVDRYLMKKLTEQEAAQFEEHFIDCEQCLEQLEVTANFRRALKLVAAEIAPPEEQSRRGASVAWLNFRPSLAAFVYCASALLVISSVVLLFLDNRNLRRELNRISNEYNRQQAQLAQLKEAEEREQNRPDPVRRLEDQSNRRQGAAQAEAASVAPSESYQINIPVFVLSAVREAARSASRSRDNEIIISTVSSSWIVFSLPLENEPEYKTYQVRLLKENGRPLLTIRGLRPDKDNALTIGFRSNYFRPGDYLLALEGAPREGRPVPVTNYPLRITEKTVQK